MRDHTANLADQIHRDLRARILSGALGAGARLAPERDLAREYDTNRNTLREAVRRLEAEGLITVRHGQGVTVSDFRRTATIGLLAPFLEHGPDGAEKARVVADLLPARARVLETAVGFAAERAGAQDLARLRAAAEGLIAAADRGDRAAMAERDLDLVDALVDAAHSVPVRWIANPFLEATRQLIRRFPGLWLVEPGFPEQVRVLLDTLAAGDAEGAMAATRERYRRVDAVVLEALRALLDAAADPPRASEAAVEITP